MIPGGLASINRKADPVIAFARAQGARMWDVDGNEYIDYHAGFAPYILGHNDPDQLAAVNSALFSGRSNYGSGPTEEEGELARLFLSCLPMADKVQFFNTGSEATAQAIRIARAYTGRDHVIRMQGGYNGNQNVVAANLMTPPPTSAGNTPATSTRSCRSAPAFPRANWSAAAPDPVQRFSGRRGDGQEVRDRRG